MKKLFLFTVISLAFWHAFVWNIYAVNSDDSIVSLNKDKLYSFVSDIFEKVWKNIDDTWNVEKNIEDLSEKNLFEDKSYFDDIVWNKYEQYIKVLQEYWVVRWFDNKFFPDKLIHLDAYIKMLIKCYWIKIWYKPNQKMTLTDKNYLWDLNYSNDTKKYLNTAYELWFLENVDNDFWKNVDYNVLLKIYNNIEKQYPNLVRWKEMTKNMYSSKNKISRGKISELTVKFFNLRPLNWIFFFDDTVYHKYWKYVNLLAEKNIVNRNNPMFFIDKKIKRSDFLVMLFRISKFYHYNFDWVSIFDDNIVDVQNKPYKSDIDYLYHKWILDYLLEFKKWKLYLYPNKNITEDEIYYILNKFFWWNFIYDIDVSSKKTLTRWKVSEMFVKYFFLWKKKKIFSFEKKDIVDVNKKTSHIGILISSIKNILNNI